MSYLTFTEPGEDKIPDIFAFLKRSFPQGRMSQLNVLIAGLATVEYKHALQIRWHGDVTEPIPVDWGSPNSIRYGYFHGTFPLILPDLRDKGLLPSRGPADLDAGLCVYVANGQYRFGRTAQKADLRSRVMPNGCLLRIEQPILKADGQMSHRTAVGTWNPSCRSVSSR